MEVEIRSSEIGVCFHSLSYPPKYVEDASKSWGWPEEVSFTVTYIM